MDKNKDCWTDLLYARRHSSDTLWLSFHNWKASEFKHSKHRNFTDIRNAVFEDPQIKLLIKESPAARRKVEAILTEMSHTWSLRTIRFMGFFVTKIMKSIYKNLWVSDELPIPADSYYASVTKGAETLQQKINRISEEAIVLYLPTHRSYADFVIFSYVCFAMNLPLPSIAAGLDFLQLNLVASLLRACGAFFIRRSFRNDSLYWETFRAYVQTQILGGERPLEFFIEGTRSRSGKSLYPKVGLLGVILDLFFAGKAPDVVIIPVSMSYDRTLEEQLYAKELIPPTKFSGPAGEKPKETTPHLIAGAKAILADDYGSVYIRFGKPLSVRELSYSFNGKDLRQQIIRTPQLASDFLNALGKDIVCEHVTNLVLSPFAYFSVIVTAGIYSGETGCIGHCGKPSPSTSTVAQYSIYGLQQIVELVEALCVIVPSRNSSHLVVKTSCEQALLEAFDVHKSLIHLQNNGREINVHQDPLSTMQLRHYANQAMQLLVDIAICSYVDNFESFVKIKHLLHREFIFRDDEHGSDRLPELFERSAAVARKLESRVRMILAAHVMYYLNAYLSLVTWLKTATDSRLSIKALIKEAQKEVELPSDVIDNTLHLFIARNVLYRDGGSQNLVVNSQSLNQLYQEVFSLALHGGGDGAAGFTLKPKL